MSDNNQIISFVKWSLKWLGLGIGGVLVGGLAIAGGIWAYSYLTYERHVSAITAGAFNTLDNHVSAVFRERCSSDLPIHVGYVNESSRTIEKIWLQVEARLPNRSTNILNHDARVVSDLIVPPGEGAGACHSFNNQFGMFDDLVPGFSEARYTAIITRVEFAD